jgi:multiple sugar transport system substrate-binding protein
LKKSAFVVLIVALALSLLVSACGGGTSNTGGGTSNTGGAQTSDGKSNSDAGAAKEPVVIEFAAGFDPTGEVVRSIERFNQSRQDIQIKYIEMPQVPNEQLTRYSTWFNSKSKTPDLFIMDVIWPKMFASAGWIAPIDEYVDDEYLKRFWPAATEVANLDGKLYGIQYYMDVGVFFYRKDLLEKYQLSVPTTWSEMEKVSQEIMSKENNPNLVGYVFQGAKIEGATINWLEFLWGMGGDVFDADGKLKVDTPEGIEALKTMQRLVHESKVSPISVAASNPNDNQIVFSNGNAIFMRNWPSYYAAMKGTDVDGKYDIAPLPHTEGFESHASTGGWVLAINSNSKYKKEAAEVMKWILSDSEQKSIAINASKIPSVRQVFSDPELISNQPLLEKLQPMLEQAKSRPALRAYEQFSRAVQTEVNLVLNGQKEPEQALKDAQTEIDKMNE